MCDLKHTAKFVLIFLTLGLVGFFLGCGEASSTTGNASTKPSSSGPTATPEPIVDVKLGEVIALVESNNVAGDAKYKGKLIKTTGIISEIEKDHILVQQLDRDEFLEMNDAKCSLSKDELSKVVALRADQTVTITGRVSGFGTFLGIRVEMKNCRILEVDGGSPQTGTSEATDESQPGAVLDVKLSDVIKLVDSNNVAGDAKYKGKLIKTTGIISEIEKDYILVQELDRDEFLEMDDAKCNLAKEELGKVIELRADQQVTITGQITGFGTSFGIRVEMKDCRIL